MVFARHFKTSECLGHLYSIFDLQSVKWKGDKQMDAFRDLWDHYLGNMQTAQRTQQEIEYLFPCGVEKSEVMKHDTAYYHRLHEIIKTKRIHSSTVLSAAMYPWGSLGTTDEQTSMRYHLTK